MMRWLVAPLALMAAVSSSIADGEAAQQAPAAPYPPSAVFRGITWHWETLRTAAPGSDLWPVTWSADGSLYAAWGDGGGFGGTDSDGRVAMGFARIDGDPGSYRAVNINGGKNAEHPASFPQSGKTGSILAVGTTLYAWINMQNGAWPDVDHALAWSENGGATWTLSPWVFARGAGRMKPCTFLNFGKGNTGVPDGLRGYVYFYAVRQGIGRDVYLGRVPETKLRDRSAYQYCAGMVNGRPAWSGDDGAAKPVFQDARSNDSPTVIYDAPMKRYLLTAFHNGPGQLGLFDAPEPWGPWTTVAYYEDWGQMGAKGEGLTCSFPARWMSKDGLALWCVFSVYGEGAQQGIQAHDRFNLVKATLIRR